MFLSDRSRPYRLAQVATLLLFGCALSAFADEPTFIAVLNPYYRAQSIATLSFSQTETDGILKISANYLGNVPVLFTDTLSYSAARRYFYGNNLLGENFFWSNGTSFKTTKRSFSNRKVGEVIGDDIYVVIDDGLGSPTIPVCFGKVAPSPNGRLIYPRTCLDTGIPRNGANYVPNSEAFSSLSPIYVSIFDQGAGNGKLAVFDLVKNSSKMFPLTPFIGKRGWALLSFCGSKLYEADMIFWGGPVNGTLYSVDLSSGTRTLVTEFVFPNPPRGKPWIGVPYASIQAACDPDSGKIIFPIRNTGFFDQVALLDVRSGKVDIGVFSMEPTQCFAPKNCYSFDFLHDL